MAAPGSFLVPGDEKIQDLHLVLCLVTDGEDNSEGGRVVKAARTLGLPISSSLEKVCSLKQNTFSIHFELSTLWYLIEDMLS